MTIFVNATAGGGTAAQRWQRFTRENADRIAPTATHVTHSITDLQEKFAVARSAGETEFVAAGGDGTVSSLLQLVVAERRSHPDLKLGAIGLGSSNDFHKPRAKDATLPSKLDFEKSKLRDVGAVTYRTLQGNEETRYWLLNASIGVTAEANAFFNLSNNESRVLSSLKRRSTDLAILYAALRTIFRYRNRTCTIESDPEISDRSIYGHRSITNLGILKSPHFAGDFMYDAPLALDSGFFHLRLAHDQSRFQLLRLMTDLSHGRFGNSSTRASAESKWLRVTSDEPFALEFDGEVIRTTSAAFALLPHYLKVCP